MHKVGTNIPKLVPPYVGLNIFGLGERLVMVPMPHNVLTKVVHFIFVTICSTTTFNLNNLSTIKKLFTNYVSMGFNNIRLVS